MTGFKATVCASTGDNRHNCAPTRWGTLEKENNMTQAKKNELQRQRWPTELKMRYKLRLKTNRITI